ncbi:hypothetical protein [Jatrophihabitans sp.]|uniref:hypothetical protein n=1 Tax=Jatrophihabitans sp. TaxID=1932789 RepID=UPI002EE6AAA7
MSTFSGASSEASGEGVPITVLFDPKLIRAWIDTGVAPPDLVSAGDLVTSQDLPLSPVHPGTTDPTLAAAFTVNVPDEGVANRLLSELQSHRAVAAAYVKPPESLPSEPS